MLAGGTAGGQLVALLVAPILTRLYTPEDFGVLAVYVGVVSLFSVVASLKYELSIPLPENEDDAVALTLLSLIIVVLISLLVGICVLISGGPLSEFLGIPSLEKYLWLVPIGIFLAGVFQVFNYRAVRDKEFSVLAKAKIAQQLSIATIQVFTFKLGGVGLLLGHATGQGVGIQTLYKRIISKDSWRLTSLRRIKSVAIRYRNFPLYSTWGGLLNTAGSQVPPILFASVFGAATAGMYALAHRVIALPMGVLGQAVSQVFLANAAIDHRSGQLSRLVISAQRMLVNIILPPVAFLILFGSKAFLLVFGSNWGQSGEVASWLALWMLVSFSTSPLSSIFTVIERQSLGLLMQGGLFVARVCGIGIGIYYEDFMTGVIWYSVFSVLGYLTYQVVAFYSIGLSVLDCLKGYTFASGAVLMALAIKDELNQLTMLIIFVFGCLFSMVYYYRIIQSLKND